MLEIKKIIDSNSKMKLLIKLLERPKASFTVSELGRLAGLPKASVSNIVSQWYETGLVNSRYQGRNKIISINKNFYLLPEIKKIFEKTKEPQKPLLEEIESMSILKNRNIKAVVLFGSRARNDYTRQSDIDIFIGVEKDDGQLSEKIVESFVKATNRTGVRFSPLILDKKEIQERKNEKDLLIKNILSEGNIIKGGKWLADL